MSKLTMEHTILGDQTIWCGDALEVLATLPDASVHLIVCDPPYSNVKTSYLGETLLWDRQWQTREAYVQWLRGLALEWQRVLTPNGSLYCFSAPHMAAHVEIMLGEIFTVLNRITWKKHDGSGAGTGGHSKCHKEDLRAFFPASESILFCEHHGADTLARSGGTYHAACADLKRFVFEPLRAYLDGERRRAGIRLGDCDVACGVRSIASRHYFSVSQWCLPTKIHYQELQTFFQTHGRSHALPFGDFHPSDSRYGSLYHDHTDYEYLRADYEYLRADYESLRADYESLRADYESLRRPFYVSAQVPYTDVWEYATVPFHAGKHPCEKPLPLLRHIITTSSRPGDTVLDCFLGSGSTLDAAKHLGRCGIGIEQDRRWYAQSMSRLSQEVLFFS